MPLDSSDRQDRDTVRSQTRRKGKRKERKKKEKNQKYSISTRKRKEIDTVLESALQLEAFSRWRECCASGARVHACAAVQ